MLAPGNRAGVQEFEPHCELEPAGIPGRQYPPEKRAKVRIRSRGFQNFGWLKMLKTSPRTAIAA